MSEPSPWSPESAAAALTAPGLVALVGPLGSGVTAALHAVADANGYRRTSGFASPTSALLPISWLTGARHDDPAEAGETLIGAAAGPPVVVTDAHLLAPDAVTALLTASSELPVLLGLDGLSPATPRLLEAVAGRLTRLMVPDRGPGSTTSDVSRPEVVRALRALDEHDRVVLLALARAPQAPATALAASTSDGLRRRGLVLGEDELRLAPPLDLPLCEEAFTEDSSAAHTAVSSWGHAPLPMLRAALALGRGADELDALRARIDREGTPADLAEATRLLATHGHADPGEAAARLNAVGRPVEALRLPAPDPVRARSLAGVLAFTDAALLADEAVAGRLAAWPQLAPPTASEDRVTGGLAVVRSTDGERAPRLAALARDAAADGELADATALRLLDAATRAADDGARAALRALEAAVDEARADGTTELAAVLRTAAAVVRALCLAEIEALDTAPLTELGVRGLLGAVRATVHADAGRSHDALHALGAVDEPDSPAAAVLLAWARGEAELAAGRPGRVVAAPVPAAASGPTGPLTPVVDAFWLARAWAATESGEAPAATPVSSEAADLELTALRTIEDHGAARAAFRSAASAWRGRSRRSELRCAWAAASAALRAGDTATAATELQAVEEDAAAHALLPLVARCRTSRRQTGVVLRARDAGTGGLTGREREVLELVGEGLTTKQIAQQLGVAPSTVETHVRSGVRRLGARSRVEAAATVRGST